MKVSVVIPAAGQGKRMKAEKNKQFLLLDEKPILAHTIAKFEDSKVDEIIVVAKEDELDYCRNEIIKKYKFNKVDKVVVGGDTRQESVYNGLQKVSADSDFVLIHDGARPLLTAELINNIITGVKKYQAVAVGVPVKDTIKVVNQQSLIINTPNRSKLVAIQTPQAFSYGIILKAYKQAIKDDFIGTDSASLVERLGQTVKVIRGSDDNLKITTPKDLEFAKAILAGRK